MSIATRIEAIEEHIGDIYDTLTLGGADLTGVNKNLVNVTSQLKDRYLDFMNNGTWSIWNNCEKVTGEGTSLSLSPTIQAPMKNDLKGNTSQTGTPTPSSPIPVNVVSGDNEIVVCGKNLFDKNNVIENYRFGSSGDLFGDNSYYASYYIGVEANTTYSFNALGASECVCEYNKNGTFVVRTLGGQATKITTNSNTRYIRVAILKTNINVFQLEKGSSATTYEPYQGNTYNIDLPVENLFDISSISANTYINYDGATGTSSVTNLSDYTKVFPSKTYTLSYSYTTLANPNSRSYCWYDENKTYISGNTYNPTNAPITLTTPNNARYIRFAYDKNCTNIKFTQENSPTPIELCKIGNYQDYIYKEDDKWYLHKEIGKVVFNGSEEWNINSNQRLFVHTGIDLGVWGTTAVKDILTNYYESRQFEKIYDGTYDYGISFGSSTADRFCVRNKDISDVNSFKTWLNTHNLNVYYQLATPTNTEITYLPLIYQLEAWYQAKSKNGQTNISQINNDLPFIINSTMLKEV